jgi:integrase
MQSVAQENKNPRRSHKRARGEGSIRQRSDGLWIARVMVGYRPDGKPDIRSVSAKKQGDCQRKLSSLKRQRDEGILSSVSHGRDTVGTFLGSWLEAVEGTVRSSTHARHQINVTKHLAPALGRHKLTGLRPEHVVDLYAAKRRAGLAPRSIKNLHTTLRKALGAAVTWRVVSQNVAAHVQPPRAPRTEMQPPKPEALVQLLERAAAAGDRFAPLWTVAVCSGCRRGELLGLKWEDVDFDAGTIAIRRTLARARGGRPEFEEAKTNPSRRLIKLSDQAIAALKVQKDRQAWNRQKLGEGYADHGLVFAADTGAPLMGRNVIRAFKAALDRAGLPRATRIHDLRHAHATMLRKAGVELKTVSERLGHSSIVVTADIYTHAVDGEDADAAARVEAVMLAARAGAN